MLTAAPPESRRSESADPAVRASAAFLRRLFPIPRLFDVRLWDGTVLPADGESVFTLAVSRPGSLRRMFRIPLALSLGEAYGRGDFEIEGDVWSAAPGMQAYKDGIKSARDVREITRLWRALPKDDAAGPDVDADERARIRAAQGSREWDLKGIRYHYDAGNDIYRLFLGRRMIYSCGYFPTGAEDLDTAQERKLEHICRKLRLQPGERVIEAGCGWGSLALLMAKRYGVTVRAFNISSEQIAFARGRARAEGLAGRVEFVEDDYRNMTGEYDAFVSIGMLEHVGAGNYKELGALMSRSIGSEGRGLVHSIGRDKPGQLNAWIDKRIFPGAHPPTLREMMDLFESNNLSVLDVENIRLHYARTLEQWLERYEESVDKVRAMFDETFVRAWRLYLVGSIAAFTTGKLQLFQVLYAPSGAKNVPWTRKHVYDGHP
jgi:cyclopropane-fatty-acyl-phospholipid synthase